MLIYALPTSGDTVVMMDNLVLKDTTQLVDSKKNEKRKHQAWWETKKNRNALSECEKKYIKLGRPERSTEK